MTMPLSEVFNIDCLEGMKQYPDKYFDLAIVDPEYGRGEDGGRDRSGSVKQINGSSLHVKSPQHKKKNWDKKPIGPEYFEQLIRVSKNQIVWGCNYYSIQLGPGRIIWDKVNDGSDQSAAEIAFYSGNSRVDMFRFMWRGMMQGKSITEGHIQQGNKKLNEKIIHPTQKPVPLYKWLLKNYGAPNDWFLTPYDLRVPFTILDTHLGSGSSRIAAYDMGFDFTGFEIDKDYFEAQEKRFKQFMSQTKLAL